MPWLAAIHGRPAIFWTERGRSELGVREEERFEQGLGEEEEGRGNCDGLEKLTSNKKEGGIVCWQSRKINLLKWGLFYLFIIEGKNISCSLSNF